MNVSVVTSICGNDIKIFHLFVLFLECFLRSVRTSPTSWSRLYFLTDGGLVSQQAATYFYQRVNELSVTNTNLLVHVVANETHTLIGGIPHLFKKCSVNRLIAPNAIETEDVALYVDLDAFILSPPSLLSKYGEILLDEQKLFALTIENSNHTGYYWVRRRLGTICTVEPPFAGDTGVNAGVMLMNFRELRRRDFLSMVLKMISRPPGFDPPYAFPLGCPTSFVFRNYRFPLGDQDIINYYLFTSSNDYIVLPDAWNWRLGDSSLDHMYPLGLPHIFHANRDLFTDRARFDSNYNNHYIPEPTRRLYTPALSWAQKLYIRVRTLAVVNASSPEAIGPEIKVGKPLKRNKWGGFGDLVSTLFGR